MARVYYELGVNIIAGGNPCSLIFHLFIVDPSVANEFLVAKSIVEALDDGVAPTPWLTRLLNLMSEEAFISTIRCRQFSPDGGNTADALFQVDDLVGAYASPIAAVQVAGCVIWNSSEEADKTGRNFIPAVPKSQLANGRFLTDYQDKMDLFIARTITGFNVSAGTALFCIFNREFDGGRQITGGYLSPKPGTQRRRELPL